MCGRLWRGSGGSRSERLVIDTALGLGIVSMLIFALGALGLFKVPWVVLVSVAGIGGAWAVARDLLGVLRAMAASRCALSVLAGVLLLALAAAALIPALAPPSMSDWDSLAYHLSVPKLYLQHGGVYYIPFTSHSNFPFLMEMLYVPGLAAHLPAAAKMMNYWSGVLLVAAVVVVVRRHFSLRAAPLAAIALAGMPIVLWEATTAYVDLSTALYTVVAVHFLLNYLDTSEHRWVIGCGIAAGLAASTKMTGLAVVPLLIVWLLADRLASEKRRVEWKPALALGAVALAVCSPWYIKSLIYTGNPVYPFFYSVFGGRNWTAAMARNYSVQQAQFGLGHDVASLVTVPFDLTFVSQAFYDTPGLYVGPLFLAAVPLFFLARYSRRTAGLAGFVLAQTVIWFVLTQQSRYLMPVFALLAVYVAAAAHEERLRLARAALWATCVVTALFGIWTLYPAAAGAAPVVFGQESRSDYLSRTLDIYPAEQWMNENLPKGATVALYGDTRGFYMDRNYVWADPGHNATFSKVFRSVKDYVAYLKQQGVTHVMVNSRFFTRREDARGTSALVYQAIDEGYFEQVYPDGYDSRGTTVYRIR